MAAPVIFAPVSRWGNAANAYQPAQFSYKGADAHSRFRDFGNPPSPLATEEEVLPAEKRRRLVGRLYDLARDNEYVAGIVEALVTAVGTVSLRSISDRADNDKRESFYFSYFNGLEATGENIDAVIRIILEQFLTAGEVVISLLDGGRIQLIESSYIGSVKDVFNTDGSSEVQGVIRDPFGRVTGYRLARSLGNGTFTFENGPILPAATTLWVGRKDRPNQVRGIPWLSGAINPLQDLAELNHARTQQAKNGAMLSMVVTKNEPPEVEDDQNGQRSDYKQLRTGAIYYTAPGESIELVQSSTNAADLSEYTRNRLESVLSTIGMPLEALYGYRLSNYASSKATSLIFKRKIDEIRRLIEAKFLNPLYAWRTQKAVDERDLDVADNMIVWGWTAYATLDPQRDAAVNAMNLANNITTLQEIAADRNQYWGEVMEQRARELAKATELGAKYNINPQALMDTAKVTVNISETPEEKPAA